MLSCRQGKSGRHRATIPKHTLKLAARLLIAVTEDNPRAKPAAKRKSARTNEVAYKRLAENRRMQIETLLRQGYSQAKVARTSRPSRQNRWSALIICSTTSR